MAGTKRVQTGPDLSLLRLVNQRLIATSLRKPEDVVECLGAVQAQDYAGAKWTIAQRTRSGTDADVEQAFQSGSILRTHVLRPTWHFVLPGEIRWMLQLTAARVHAANAYHYRKFELDAKTFRRAKAAVTKALQGGKHRTREELSRALADAGIAATGVRLGLLMVSAELDALVCSGPRRNTQFTYALLDERVPPTRPLARDEALALLAERYFGSHGPSTLQDFAWWSGLTMKDVRAGIETLKPRLTRHASDGKTYWFIPPRKIPRPEGAALHLLSNFDEYLVCCRQDCRALSMALLKRHEDAVLPNHFVMLDGKPIGGWRRVLTDQQVMIHTTFLARLSKDEKHALHLAADHYERFLGLPVKLSSI